MNHPSHQAHGQRELNVVVPAPIPVREILKIEGDIAHLQIAAPPKLMGDVDGYVLRPMFGGIESDDANWLAVLPCQKILNDYFEVGGYVIGFPPGAAGLAQIIRY
jgi:hypothetical protein